MGRVKETTAWHSVLHKAVSAVFEGVSAYRNVSLPSFLRTQCVYEWMYEQRCGKLTVSCEYSVCVFVLRGFTGARNRDLVFIAFRMMTLLPPVPSPFPPISDAFWDEKKDGMSKPLQEPEVEATSRRTGRR